MLLTCILNARHPRGAAAVNARSKITEQYRPLGLGDMTSVLAPRPHKAREPARYNSKDKAATGESVVAAREPVSHLSTKRPAVTEPTPDNAFFCRHY